ncbi:hypothetical protein FGADI_10461 [Fusarium gaditjirri]|uniref:Trichothecene 3-O-acetyltransferase-like N-terminal domain-containing protein n=1 Tax=Fusarium gaditjirri TaxID=282569 RepID=A0A8H4WRM9_9HYPO|nr:hypothetical protein FGADI_10461 [Fusarium gaditjirri]
MFDLDIELDPMTNRVYLGEYYNLSFVFLTNPSSAFANFVSGIHQGLERLSKQFPWITGQVKSDRYITQQGIKYKIVPFQTALRFQVDTHQQSSPFDFKSSKDKGFPMIWINGHHVPIHMFSSDSGPFPVMELKFTIEKGASILTISGHSKVFDTTGLCMMIRMLAKACRQERLTSLEISAMENHAAFLRNNNKMQRHKRVPVTFVPDLLLPQTTSFQERNIKWALFSFDRDVLQYIKDKGMSSDSPAQYLVDTDKALTAFVLRNICCARNDRVEQGTTVKCFRTVDARKAQAVNGEYLGALQHMTCTSFINPSAIPIGRIAMDIHNASSPGLLSQDVAQYVWSKGREYDNPYFNSDAIFNPSLDVAIVSWARVECGSPEYMFQPNWLVWCIRVP